MFSSSFNFTVLFIVSLALTHCGHLRAFENVFQVEKIIVKKSERKMSLLDSSSKVVREYSIALGDSPKGHKTQEGDEKTPEGIFKIDYRNPKSSYYLSLHITYPSKADKLQAKKRGVSPGGDIFIHGSPNGFSLFDAAYSNFDWTDGCIAVSNKEIEEIWMLVKNGTEIEILP